MTEPHLIGGRYELGDLLGRGGMAEVRKGRDIRLGRTVAIKRLRTDLASDQTFQARFRREAQSAASLNHPTIVSVYDTGEEVVGDDHHVPYIVMEYVEGLTLRDVIRSGETLLPERSLEIVAGVLRALAYSHHAGIVHRDIKPANVMLTPAGEVKVMDFGIARAIADTSATMTQTAAVIGTAQYLSPEQARGAQVDARSDLYSTGCLLYELLTSRAPFVGDSPVSVAYQHVREHPQPPSVHQPGLSPEIDAIVMRALEKNPDDRYQSAEDMRADAERAMRGEQVEATATQMMPQPTQMMPQVNRPVSQVGYAGAGFAGGGAATSVVREEYADPEPPRGGRGTAWAIGILTVILLAALGFIIFQVLGNGDDPTTAQSEVPPITGLDEPAAQILVETVPTGATEAPFTLAACAPASDGAIEAGLIVSQVPDAGVLADDGTEITCVVSTGVAETTVPQLVGLTQDQAEAQLTQAGLDLGQVTPQDGTTAAGEVLSSEPQQGAGIAEGGEVNLVVASGRNAVPSIVDLSQADAEVVIREAGFVVGTPTEEENGDVEPGTVLRQDPAADVVVDLGTTINFVTAIAPPVETTPVPDVSSDGPTFDEAETELNDAGFTNVTISAESDQACQNNPNDQCIVIEQDPAAGTEVEDPAAQEVVLLLQQQNGGGRLAGAATAASLRLAARAG
ncbi:MAG: Stk1 family PASTA domain-containing Ser/Thr kinase [Actinomycetes bacterium]